MMKKTVLLTVPTALAFATSTHATIFAGWDDFTTGFITSDDVDATYTDGVDAHFNVTGDQIVLFSDGRGASTDATFGALAGPPTPSTATGARGVSLAFANGSNAMMTFTVTNNSGGDLEFGQLVFDSYARRPRAARTYELSVLAGGGLSDGVVFTSDPQIITHTGGSIADTTIHDEISISFAGLADTTLGNGESVDLLLNWTGGDFGNAQGHDLYLDNIAFTTEPGAQPGDPADLDGDGDVDDADFGIAFAAFTGPNNGPSSNPAADLDGDGDVDDADFGIAFAAFTGPGGAAVPEPTSLALLGLGGLLIARRRRA